MTRGMTHPKNINLKSETKYDVKVDAYNQMMDLVDEALLEAATAEDEDFAARLSLFESEYEDFRYSESFDDYDYDLRSEGLRGDEYDYYEMEYAE